MSNSNSVGTQSRPVYIITGATGGMGSVIAGILAAQGKPVLLACRNLTKAKIIANDIIASTKNPDVTCMHLDLSSFAQVKEFLTEFKALNRPVAALMNNAGVLSHNHQLSPDGYENTIQVNFLSTVMLSLGLYPQIVDGGRIVFTTSLTRSLVSLPYEFPAVNNFTQLGTYAQSKLALTLFSIYLSSMMRTRRIKVNCTDPGIVDTDMLTMHHWFDRLTDRLVRPFVNNPETGVQPAIRALESSDTGFIFKGTDRQIKTTSILKNREVFIKLCNDTMRLIKKQL
jgi:NAD(P)-dependent dehydrogenase (short-subunit alcohol dehydrogenase family)